MRTPSLPIRLMHNVWRGVADTLLVVLLAVVVGGGGATGQKPCPQQLCFYCGCSAVQTETSAMQDSLSVTLTVSDGRLLGGCVAGMPMEPAVEDCDSEGGSCARREGEVDHLASLEAMMRDEQKRDEAGPEVLNIAVSFKVPSFSLNLDVFPPSTMLLGSVAPYQLMNLRYHAVHTEAYKWFDVKFDKFGWTSSPQQTEVC
uniref:Uncharacterized protein n=1 Tax=Leersia perrieri TaxID=77586 RepID=A0A0D9WXY9_9ORYZ